MFNNLNFFTNWLFSLLFLEHRPRASIYQTATQFNRKGLPSFHCITKRNITAKKKWLLSKAVSKSITWLVSVVKSLAYLKTANVILHLIIRYVVLYQMYIVKTTSQFDSWKLCFEQNKKWKVLQNLQSIIFCYFLEIDEAKIYYLNLF